MYNCPAVLRVLNVFARIDKILLYCLHLGHCEHGRYFVIMQTSIFLDGIYFQRLCTPQGVVSVTHWHLQLFHVSNSSVY